MKKRRTDLSFTLLPAFLAILLLFSAAISNLRAGHSEAEKQQLEAAISRAAAACYAAEGIYPPNLEYLETHYGIQIDRNRYTVMYEAFASNLMPDITILENG